jgi:hypothetical protein
MDINPVLFSSQLQLSVVALAFGRRSQISYGSCQFAFRPSISVIIASALLSRLGRAPTFWVPIINPPFADNRQRSGVPKDIEKYRRI